MLFNDLPFNSELLRDLHYKLGPCRNQEDIFNTSIAFVKYNFPKDNFAQDLAQFENPTSTLNLYFNTFQKQMLSTQELVSTVNKMSNLCFENTTMIIL